MKTLIISVLLILHSVSSYCQIPDGALSIEDEAFNDCFFDRDKIPMVKGRVLNMSDKDIGDTKIKYTIVTPFDQRQMTKYSSLNLDGTFELKLDYAFPYQQIWLSFGELFYAGIYANTDLFIELDVAILKSEKEVSFNGPGVKYLGSDGELNNYKNNHVLFKRMKQLRLNSELQKVVRDRKIDYDTFITKYDSLYSILQKLDEEYMDQNPSDYSWILINERQSDYYGDLCVKHWGKEMDSKLFEKVKAHKSYVTSNSGIGFYNYLFTYLKYASRKGYKKDYSAYKSYSGLIPKNISTLDSIISTDKMREGSQPYDTSVYLSMLDRSKLFLHDTLIVERTLLMTTFLDNEFKKPKADFLKTKITSKNPEIKALQMESVLNSSLTNWCRTVILEKYNQNLSKLESINKVLDEAKPLNSNDLLGRPIAEMPSGAKMFQVDNIESKQLLSNLKASFEGKALVIDFWATWCAPCLQEMPYSKKLHNEVSELPVEFIYLCTSSGSSLDQWKLKIAEYELSGTHIFVDEKIENALMNMFSVSGYPSYIFIDKEGFYKPGAIGRMSNLSKEKLAGLLWK